MGLRTPTTDSITPADPPRTLITKIKINPLQNQLQLFNYLVKIEEKSKNEKGQEKKTCKLTDPLIVRRIP